MTYRELLNRLTSLRALTLQAPTGEKSGCQSSYDRSSCYLPEEDRYVSWSANDDGSGCIRRLPDGSIVAFESEGPGVIWRVWSALPQQGHIRVFIDDRKTPEIDMPFIDWFEKQPGDIPPLNLSELSMRLSRGRNSYIPIPFQKSCRIELAPDWGAYYHFTYTLFPAGTRMPSYGERFTKDGMIALAETDRFLYDRGETLSGNGIKADRTVLPKQTAVVFKAEDAGAITEFAVDPEGADLTHIVLRMYWDGQQLPAVEAPLVEFFGGAQGYVHYRCLPMSMERARYTCRFVMPFAQGCRVEVANLGSQAQTVHFHWTVETCDALEPGTMRFHAKYHRGYWGGLDQSRFVPGGDRWPDWPMLLVHGAAGRFLGVHLHVLNQWKTPREQPAEWWYGAWDRKTIDWWWGEGDEKFFVDGERFPSTFGTGSEDYIGYAWAAEPPFARFDSPYACLSAMPIDGNGHTGVSRFHVADSVPFTSGIEAFIEKYKADQWGDDCRCLYAAVPYWYQAANTNDAYPSVSEEDLLL